MVRGSATAKLKRKATNALRRLRAGRYSLIPHTKWCTRRCTRTVRIHPIQYGKVYTQKRGFPAHTDGSGPYANLYFAIALQRSWACVSVYSYLLQDRLKAIYSLETPPY